MNRKPLDSQVMKMPTEFKDDFFNVEGRHHPDGAERKPVVYSMVFPSVGFFPFAGTGNGDYHGLYWPIGREEGSPLVAYSSHDAYALIPEYGDMMGAGRCQIALSEDACLSYEFEEAFAAAGLEKLKVEAVELVEADNHRKLLEMDPDSPFRNCAVADLYVGENDLERAEAHYRRAIELLPEYGAAHFGLGYLLRRTRRQAEASIHFRQSLICPLVFWGGCFWAEHILAGKYRNDWARKALLWLQQTKEPDISLQNDPFMNDVNKLTLETGVAKSSDIELSMRMVEEYRAMGKYVDAVFLWITVGDRAALETTSFRERYALTPKSYGIRLASLLREAGIERRAVLVEHMISALSKPEGIYL